MPLKRLLDQDPSKFRSIKQVIVLGHLGPTLYGMTIPNSNTDAVIRQLLTDLSSGRRGT